MTFEEFEEKFHIRLNQQQKEAVRRVEGPVLLLAVPGSGKTTVLVTRLAQMVCCAGIAPERILTLTYTVAAARDMAARFCSCFGSGLGERLEFRTINGVCARVIQYYGKLIGKRPFSLASERDSLVPMLSALCHKIQGSYVSEGDLKGIRTKITYIKNMMLTEDGIKRLEEDAEMKISQIYKAYCEGMRERGLMDFDDQMVYAYGILRKSPETLQYFQNRYSYICVDEAQDTSKIQYEIIRLLAGKRDNLFMVGDEDQSIYGFRAAYPQAMLAFEQEHPGAGILLMEENFRSCGKIVTAADRFIRKNTLRHPKHMKAAREEGLDIKQIEVKGRAGQYQYLEQVAQDCQAQTAVLYRENESALPLVDLLERQGIPYRVPNRELAFFNHRIVQDIRNIICFAQNPEDTDLFLQIYYKIATYISRQDALRICEIARQENMAVLEAALLSGQLPSQTENSCRVIISQLKRLLLERADLAVNRILENMGYGDYLERMEINSGKLFILKAIARKELSPVLLVKRLDELQKILKEKEDNEECPFILSTIHASKGLEYDSVYLLDIMDGIFPESVPKNSASVKREERDAYEEERRLFYVAVTRAKNRLFLFKWNQKATFCQELLEEEKGTEDKKGKTEGKSIMANTLPLYGKKPFSQEAFARFCDAVGQGLVVEHKTLGEGVVVEAGEEKMVIQFGDRRRQFGMKALFEYDLLKF